MLLSFSSSPLEYDYLIAPEAKAIPLVYEMARQSGANKYFVARKGAKAYMQGVFSVDVRSITTMGVQHLVLDAEDAKLIHGKRMLLVDDVISTGESLHALETLVTECGGVVAGRMAPLPRATRRSAATSSSSISSPLQRRRHCQGVKNMDEKSSPRGELFHADIVRAPQFSVIYYLFPRKNSRRRAALSSARTPGVDGGE